MQFRLSNSHNVSFWGLDAVVAPIHTLASAVLFDDVHSLSIQGYGVPNTHPSTIINLAIFSAVLFDNVHILEVENLLIIQSFGYGLITYNCFKHVLIKSSHSYGNYRRGSSSHTGGNALIYYDTASRGQTIIEIVNSSFFHGQCQPYQQRLGAQDSGGLKFSLS